MPRDLLRQVFEERRKAGSTQITGIIMSKFKLEPYDSQATLMPVADVMISNVILSSIPLAENNRELLYIDPGTHVMLARSQSGRLEVTGLSKRAASTIYTYVLSIPVLTADLSNAGSALSPGALTSLATVGFSTAVATLGQLASLTSGGFGATPFLAQVLTNANGTAIRIIG